MTYYLTESVTYTVPSDGWTGTVNVTNAALLTDNSVEDFIMTYDVDGLGSPVQQGSVELANWAKGASGTTLTYSGSSLNQDDVVVIYRSTPNTEIETVLPLSSISSSLWNGEIEWIKRKFEELDTFGTPTNSLPTSSVSDLAWNSANWNGVDTNAPSKNQIGELFAANDAASGYSGSNHTITPYWTFADTTDLNFDGTSSIDVTASSNLTVNLGSLANLTVSASTTGVFDISNTGTGNWTWTLGDTDLTVDGDVDFTSSNWTAVPDRAATTMLNECTTYAVNQEWVQDHSDWGECQLRLTLDNTKPGELTTQISGTDLYLVPFRGNVIWLWVTDRWRRFETTGTISLDISGYANDTPYDIFASRTGTDVQIASTVWTNRSTRATALTYQDGILVKSGATHHRYVGTVFKVSGSAYQGPILQTGNLARAASIVNSVYNYYNPLYCEVGCIDNTQTAWTANASYFDTPTGNMHSQCMVGTAEHPVRLHAHGASFLSAAGGAQFHDVMEIRNAAASIGTFYGGHNIAANDTSGWAFSRELSQYVGNMGIGLRSSFGNSALDHAEVIIVAPY